MSRVQSVDGAMPEPFIRSLVLKRELIGDATAYPFSIPAIAGLSELELDPKVTFLCGENGSGKSTLIEAIAVACGLNAEGGGRNFAVRDPRARTRRSATSLRLVRGARRPRTDFFLRAESYFNVATEIEALDTSRRWPSDHRLLRRRIAARAVARRVVPRAARAPLRPRRPLHPRRARGRALAAGPARAARAHARARRPSAASS